MDEDSAVVLWTGHGLRPRPRRDDAAVVREFGEARGRALLSAILSVYMVPGVFRTLSDFLLLPAAVDVARSVVYLGDIGVGHDLLVLAVWGPSAWL
ncbi:MAG: hypothetical protein JWN84_4498 [Nocardioides sp.]|nr:hypothetical protein [Nocardioides sp.]